MKMGVWEKKESVRYGLLDSLRGAVFLSMILFHGCWDLVYIFGVDFHWYKGTGAYIWQQSICWVFLFLSGFCWSLGRRPLKRGLMVFGGGALITLATCLAMPENRVVFGVLTCTGSCMLLMIPLHKLLKKISPETGIFFGFLLFFLTRNINDGYLGFEKINLVKLPVRWYRGLVPAYLGLPFPGFYSTDYFSLIPWIFLFISGYFFYQMLSKRKIFAYSFWRWELEPFRFLGKHSLLIYMFHQPVVYALLSLLFHFLE